MKSEKRMTGDREDLAAEIEWAHRQQEEYCRTHLTWGSASEQLVRLESWAGPTIRRALEEGRVGIGKLDETTPPRFVVILAPPGVPASGAADC